uniref:Cytochrome b5 heme-binding domain-containing protein n=1 Tax=Dracunculus medinensis TaxID=318479 RepID=A0A0N4UQM4_DRAME
LVKKSLCPKIFSNPIVFYWRNPQFESVLLNLQHLWQANPDCALIYSHKIMKLFSRFRTISREEVAKHNTLHSLWMIYEGNVLDLTKFVPNHPGGERVKYSKKVFNIVSRDGAVVQSHIISAQHLPLLENAGTDGTLRFKNVLHSKDAIKMTRNYIIGTLHGKNSYFCTLITGSLLAIATAIIFFRFVLKLTTQMKSFIYK